jgi:transposase-like protein
LAPKGQVVPLAEELKTARRELTRLRQENEILRKAAACGNRHVKGTHVGAEFGPT